jgi:hypothetical protein
MTTLFFVRCDSFHWIAIEKVMSPFVYFCIFLYSYDGSLWPIPARPENCEFKLNIHKFNDDKPFGATF